MVHTEVPPNRLRELLDQRRLKLIDVAARCHVAESTAWRWSQGLIPQKHLPAIAELLGVSVPYLAGWSANDHDTDAPEGMSS